MSMYVAFSIGSNNVANAAMPIASMKANELGIGIGNSLFGYKILKKTGRKSCFSVGLKQ